MFNPVATYRLQFHKSFTFSDLENALPYLRSLGVTSIYASPIFSATPGSTHGYDGIDPNQVNPEIGTEAQLRNISQHLSDAGMSWLQDIVPNHMAFHPGNKWLMDVLEHGKQSRFADFFDIDWESKVHDGKVMVPFLGASAEKAIKNGELILAHSDGRIVLRYYDSSYPVNKESILELIPNLEELPDLEQLNQDKALLQKIANAQHYHLCHWQETDKKINFRRFFTINGLICINIQDEQVFNEYHRLVKSLTEEGIISGLRIDHIDGLYDPGKYLHDLQELTGGDTYVVVEKILQPDESLPKHWPVQGNSGYDFLALVNNLLTNPKHEQHFTSFYQQITGSSSPVSQQIREKKAHILYDHMGGELENLYQLFKTSELGDASATTKDVLKKAIGSFLIECPVYRYYGSELPLEAEEAKAVKKIFTSIVVQHPELADGVLLLEQAILARPLTDDLKYRERAAHFYKRCMQFSGPLMAKGVEDTLMYTYNRFIGHNDVGDAPEAFGITAEQFHLAMIERQQHWPLSLNATSTHDTKRGEDVRARLNVLSDLHEEWISAVKHWQELNSEHKAAGAPDVNDEYLIYQTLVGAYPLAEDEEEGFLPRMEQFLEKALREAKTHSNWTKPNEAYEGAAKQFVRSILETHSPFRSSFMQLLDKITDAGIVNSLVQLLLKFTCPGVPDVYQGTELWDLSLVDPDNRRPVDYNQRQQLLEELTSIKAQGEDNFVAQLWHRRKDASIKLWLTHELLQLRKENPDLFASGQYLPLKVEGRYKDHIFSFARRLKGEWIIVIVPLHIASLCKQKSTDVTGIDWRDTRVLLRPEAPQEWQHLITGTKGTTSGEIQVKDVFQQIPLGLLRMHIKENERGAGILLAISSLPSRFGIGDLGTGAKRFAKFLSRSRQKYWQILPLNPTEEGAGHSPYSSYSSMAGNPLLISPELLAEEGLLQHELLHKYHLPEGDKADYQSAEKLKGELFDKAFANFEEGKNILLQKSFNQFCSNEAYWLNDMALYVVLKQHHHGSPWHQWNDEFKHRDPQALEHFANTFPEAIRKVKWLQYIFMKQWKALKHYTTNAGISFFGDMPFYVSYDSVDVWANPEIFCLDKDRNMTGVAGVPPDYFSEDGQLWGMPTFNWNKLRETNYQWWVQRLKKNLELFDLLRIDHFRAFQDYWQVPAGETTARNGEWIPGPRKEFFDVIKKELGKLPFVAEDLGDKMEDVYTLRDELGLPGMKVLQFAWGENMPYSVDIPHNYQQNTIVYTGTHDNNTTIGWYREETNKADHERMHHYLGLKVKKKNIHEILARVAYASVGKTAILPMQDILGLDADTRMNMPGKAEGNWLWRLTSSDLKPKLESMLRDWVETYNRV